MYNRGTKYLNAGNYAKALACFKRETGEFKERYLNMGNCYKWFNDLDNAEKCYILANSSRVPFANGAYTDMYALALTNLGLVEYARGNDALACDYYVAALGRDPLHYDAMWNLGNAILRRHYSGESVDVSLGWKLYEYRFKRSSGAVRIENTIATWDGVSSGSHIVVLTEQGLGDKIMFGRYLSCLRSLFSKVSVVCHESLDCLFSEYDCYRDAISSGASVSVAICSLAGIFGDVSCDWLPNFTPHDFGPGFHIGCVWSGSSTHANDRNRSVSRAYFNRLKSYGSLYSLNPAAKGFGKLDISSWSDTSSYILGLDVVVTVDTSIVHLAGSLGVPCIMVQPLHETDFRWGLGRSTTPWYPSVVIVNHSDFETAFSTVEELIKCIKK